MPDITIDGTSISSITIDGTSVKEVTIDGSVAWSSTSLIFKDTFEDNNLTEWTFYDTGNSGSSGTESSNAPDGGAYNGYIAQNSGGGNWSEIYTDNTYNWNKDYQFKFLVHSNNFTSNSDFQGTVLGWRGRHGDANTLGVSLFNTDSAGNEQPFQFAGGGVSNSTTKSMDWVSGTWYWIEGEVSETNATAKAKIWPAGNAEPTNYQISCDITTGITGQPIHMFSNGKSSVNLDLDAARIEFGNKIL